MAKNTKRGAKPGSAAQRAAVGRAVAGLMPGPFGLGGLSALPEQVRLASREQQRPPPFVPHKGGKKR